MNIREADGWRIHCADEPLATLMNPARADRWTASDEDVDTQPYGISACATLADLDTYSREYSMSIRDDDLLVALRGRFGDDDRDNFAIRLVVSGYERLATGADFRAAQKLAAQYDTSDSEWVAASGLVRAIAAELL